jgi:predicted  nucleic acid-binding Zn-ribbon protein
MTIQVHVSPGELIDKITILEIKLMKIKDRSKISAIKNELKLLYSSHTLLLKNGKNIKPELAGLKEKLYKTNLKLWNIENVIRSLEAKQDFGNRFIEYARKVYITNDKRSALKISINRLFGSTIIEVKEYAKYGNEGISK